MTSNFIKDQQLLADQLNQEFSHHVDCNGGDQMWGPLFLWDGDGSALGPDGTDYLQGACRGFVREYVQDTMLNPPVGTAFLPITGGTLTGPTAGPAFSATSDGFFINILVDRDGNWTHASDNSTGGEFVSNANGLNVVATPPGTAGQPIVNGWGFVLDPTNAAMRFTPGVTAYLQTTDAATSSDALYIYTGNAASGATGNLVLGTGWFTGTGVDGTAGSVYIQPSNGMGTGNGGMIQLDAGDATGAGNQGGAIQLIPGLGNSGANPGLVEFYGDSMLKPKYVDGVYARIFTSDMNRSIGTGSGYNMGAGQSSTNELMLNSWNAVGVSSNAGGQRSPAGYPGISLNGRTGAVWAFQLQGLSTNLNDAHRIGLFRFVRNAAQNAEIQVLGNIGYIAITDAGGTPGAGASGGSGYKVNDRLVDGYGDTYTVLAVDGSGTITQLRLDQTTPIVNAPTNPVALTNAPAANSPGSVAGVGTGASVNVTWTAPNLLTITAPGDLKLNPAGGANTLLRADPTVALGAATKQYADKMLPLTGGTVTGSTTFSSNVTFSASVGAAITITSGNSFVAQGFGAIWGQLFLGTNTTSGGATFISLNGAAGSYRRMLWQTASVARWTLDVFNTEAANAGADLTFFRFDDSGANAGAVMTLYRGTGLVQFFSGIGHGNSLATTQDDLSKHHALYSTTYGFCVTSTPARLNYIVAAGASHAFRIGGTTRMELSNSGLALTGIGITGVADASNAAAGAVGEFTFVNVTSASAVSLSNGVFTQVATLSLTAGDWDVSGQIGYTLTGITMTQAHGYCTATAPPTNPGVSVGGCILWFGTLGSGTIMPISTTRISVSATTTVYLVAYCAFSAGTAAAYGYMRARRVR